MKIYFKKHKRKYKLNYLDISYRAVYNFYIRHISKIYLINSNDLKSFVKSIRNFDSKLFVLVQKTHFKSYFKVRLIFKPRI